MDNKIREYFEKRVGETVFIDEAYKDFLETNKVNAEELPKRIFCIKSYYTRLVRQKQVSKKKYYVVSEEKSLF